MRIVGTSKPKSGKYKRTQHDSNPRVDNPNSGPKFTELPIRLQNLYIVVGSKTFTDTMGQQHI